MSQNHKHISRILFSGGGTAGHITPLLAVARELYRIGDVELHFVGQKGDKNAALISKQQGIVMHSIRAGKYRRYHNESLWRRLTDVKTFVLNLRDVAYVLVGFFQALVLLLINRPDVVFCKGGYVVVPVGFATRLLRIPYITHDSDMVPGLANRLIAKGAVKHAVVSDAVRAYPAHKVAVTGVPVPDVYIDRRGRPRATARRELNIPEHATVIFVYAGTQGAQRIDDAMRTIVPKILLQEKNLFVVHVFGRLNESSMASMYSNVDPESARRVRKLTFIDNAYDYISAADIIIARAGATSSAEFAMIGRAVVMIPAEQLTGGHQLENARMYQSANAAEIVLEKDLPNGLEEKLVELIHNPAKREELSSSIHKLARPNAAQDIAQLLMSIAKGIK